MTEANIILQTPAVIIELKNELHFINSSIQFQRVLFNKVTYSNICNKTLEGFGTDMYYRNL